MPTGMSLHVGLNAVDPKQYGGWDGKLKACEADAKDMIALAKKMKFKTKALFTADATAEAAIAEIAKAAKRLTTGDMFFFTYSGHGGQVPDKNGDEPDRMDETFVFYNRQLVDDELYALWSQFAPGVRIFVLSDCCHSGTNTRAPLYDRFAKLPAKGKSSARKPRYRAMPDDVQARTYAEHKKMYDSIQKEHRAGEKIAVNASILLISGCQDNQLSADGDRNGLFTENVLKVWKKGFSGNYSAFHRAIAGKMPPWQSPNFFRTGVKDARYEAQQPLSI